MNNEEKEIKEAKAEELTDSQTEKVSGGNYYQEEFEIASHPFDPVQPKPVDIKGEPRTCKYPGCTVQFYPVVDSQDYCPKHFNFFSATKK